MSIEKKSYRMVKIYFFEALYYRLINTEANQRTTDLFMADLLPYEFDEKVMIH